MARTKIKGGIIDRRGFPPFQGEIQSGIDYDETRFWGCRYVDCTWSDCRFSKTSFGNGMEFTGCRFADCKFLGAHTSLRGVYRNCKFENCEFRGALTEGTHFSNCVFSGVMRDLIFFGKGVAPKDRSVLSDVDFSGVRFDLTDFRLKVDLSTITFGPEPGELYIEGKRRI